MTTAGLLAGALPLLALASACGDDDRTDTGETSADGGSETGCTDFPRLRVVNDGTGNAVEELTMVACDMSEQSSFPVPPGGLPDGGELTIDLPGPGCWVLAYSGEGCEGEVPGMVEAACGETVEWTLLPENHVCIGG